MFCDIFNVISNSPFQDFTHTDDGTLLNYDMTPWFKPFTIFYFAGSLRNDTLLASYDLYFLKVLFPGIEERVFFPRKV